MKSSYEAVVVGAGPAGCSAAIHLKKLGIDVLLLDKSFFPREKICGDGIPLKCFPLLEELGIKRQVLLDRGYPIRQLNIHAPTGETISYGNPDDDLSPKSVCLARREFDFVLLSQAKKFLSQVKLGMEVIRIDKVSENGHALLLRERETGHQYEILTRMIIGADGTHSIVSRQKNMVRPIGSDQFIGLRIYCDNDYFEPKTHIIYDKLILPGYVWLFPISETRANIGMVISKDNKWRTGQNMVNIFKDIMTRHPVFNRLSKQEEIFSKIKGFPLNLGSAKGSRVKDGVILVGDAAAFINPLTGGGIFNAMLSGKHAALVSAHCLGKNDVSEKALKIYDKWWGKTLSPSFYYSSLMKKFLESEKHANWWFSKCNQHRIFANFLISIYGNPVPRLFFLNPLYWLKVVVMR
jgi:geranylgeranyl reductase family protein